MVKQLLTFAAATKVDPGAIGAPNVAADQTFINNAVDTTMIVMGAMSILFIIIGAFQYVLSNGDAGSVTKAKNTILYAVIGLVVSGFAFTIVNFVLGRF